MNIIYFLHDNSFKTSVSNVAEIWGFSSDFHLCFFNQYTKRITFFIFLLICNFCKTFIYNLTCVTFHLKNHFHEKFIFSMILLFIVSFIHLTNVNLFMYQFNLQHINKTNNPLQFQEFGYLSVSEGVKLMKTLAFLLIRISLFVKICLKYLVQF